MKLLKKIAPLAISALMLMAPLAGAVNISAWDNTFTASTTAVVVGSGTIGTQDMTAAMTVAKAVGIDTSVSSTASGSVEEEMALETAISDAFGTTLDDGDFDSFQDTTVEMSDTDISVHDELVLGALSPSIETSSSSSDRYGADPKIEFTADAVAYHYVFDEAYDPSSIDDENPLTIDFMGKSLTITGMDLAADEITAQVGDEYIMTEGETKTVDGHSVVLDTVADASVYVIVDGVAKSIAEAATVKFGSGDSALRIRLKDALYSEKKDSKAILVIGEYALRTYTAGDEFPVYCSTPATADCDADHPDWVWDIDLTDNGGDGVADDYIGVTNDFTWNNYKKPVLGLGESLKMPNDFVSIKLDSLKTDKFADYDMTFDDTYDLTEVGGSTSDNVFILEAIGQNDKGFTLAGVKTDTILLYTDGTDVFAYYINKDGDVTDPSLDTGGVNDPIEFTFVYGDSEIDAKVAANSNATTTSGYSLFVDTNGDTTVDDLELAIEDDGTDFVGFGTANEANAEDAYLDGTAIGSRKYDVLSSWGIVMLNPDEGFSEDMMTLQIPDEQQQATVVISTLETTGTQTSWTAVKDSEVTTGYTKNIIAIGGTAVNKVARSMLGLSESTPVYGTDSQWTSATDVDAIGKGILWIKTSPYNTAKYALLVAGYEGADTEKTANFLTLKSSTLNKDKAVIDTVNNVEATA